MVKIQAEKRNNEMTLAQTRANALIPAVLYGGDLKESVSVTITKDEFKKAWNEAGTSSAIEVTVDGKSYDCLIHEYQLDPIANVIIHADLLVLEKGKAVEVEVELEFVGTSPAAKANLGVLTKNLHAVVIEAMPKDLPQHIQVNLDTLVNVHDTISAGDIKLPSGVTLKTDREAIVVVVSEPQEEVESAEGIDFASIEVEKKGKEETAE